MTKLSYAEISEKFPKRHLSEDELSLLMTQMEWTPLLIREAWFEEVKQKDPKLWEKWVADGLLDVENP
jgi:hypothetical protein